MKHMSIFVSYLLASPTSAHCKIAQYTSRVANETDLLSLRCVWPTNFRKPLVKNLGVCKVCKRLSILEAPKEVTDLL
jgi:hypothetical protein